MEYSGDFDQVRDSLILALSHAPEVQVGEWQAIVDSSRPEASTFELEDVTVILRIPPTQADLAREVNPNLPWAEEHFLERVSGIPHNPPPSHVRWPHASADNEEHVIDGKFSHTYPERFWPKRPHHAAEAELEGRMSDYPPEWARRGIRFQLGDLSDVVNLLVRRPNTRQAYLAVWFPEDAYAATKGERVPCTLGYHFLIREGFLKIVYYIRSCDLRRHFPDDVYMAARLCQWVAERVGVKPGRLVMHISSLHAFSVERGIIERMAEGIKQRRLASSSGWY